LTYRRGSAVRLTFALKNLGSTAVRLVPNPSTDGITVTQGSTVVWQSSHTIVSRGVSLNIEPGKAMKLTSAWNGRPNPGGLRHLPPGVYTITATEGGYSASTNIYLV
jgi:hypothetical protein